MSGLVERLRANATLLGDDHYSDLMREAAARIERLEAALREIKELPGELNPSNYDHDDVRACNNALVEAWNIASAELEDRT